MLLVNCAPPKTDGFAFYDKIQSLEGAAEPVVLVLSPSTHSAYLSSERLQKASYILKPIRPWELQARLSSILEKVGAPDNQPERLLAQEEDVGGPVLRVLLGEDNPVTQRLGSKLLSKHGCAVRIAGDGNTALAAVTEERFDVILMDIQMPGSDGYATTAEIRRQEAGSGIRTPIIGLSAHTADSAREACLLAGMDGYASKPIQFAALMAEIQSVMQRVGDLRPVA
jgi:two-component system, sensor histidine kinase and response regulator